MAGGTVPLSADLTEPPDPIGLVLFAHGSGSNRHSPRNTYVADALQESGLATLLVDLLTVDEARRDVLTATYRFDIALLCDRLTAAVEYARTLTDRPIGLFGASTSAAAALMTAARRPHLVAAIVSRGGRPDLAGPALRLVRAPTLLIVGGADTTVVKLNRRAFQELTARPCELRIVPGAGHLFEEPGALDTVVRYTVEWFQHHFTER